MQAPFDVAVVMPTVVRPTMVQAIQSVFAQRFHGRVQILIGIDRWDGQRAIVDRATCGCPSHMAVTILDLGYSTSVHNGGLYPSKSGGALKTILSYAANSRYVAYLDDDNWYAPDHLATMRVAIEGKAWAFSLRHFVDSVSGRLLCADTWESVGPGRGVYRTAHGGFIDTNCLCIDKTACHDVFPEWAMSRYPGGIGDDRHVFEKLRNRPHGSSNLHTLYYRVRLARQHFYQLWRMKCAGVDLASYMSPQDIPGEDVWQRCATFDRAGAAKRAATQAKGAAGRHRIATRAQGS